MNIQTMYHVHILSALGCYMLHVHTTVCIGVLYVACTHYCLHWGVICCMYTLLSALGCYMLHVHTTVCIGVLYVACTHYCLHWGVICIMYTLLSALGCYMLHVHTTVCIGVLYVACTHYCLHWGVICCMYTIYRLISLICDIYLRRLQVDSTWNSSLVKVSIRLSPS